MYDISDYNNFNNNFCVTWNRCCPRDNVAVWLASSYCRRRRRRLCGCLPVPVNAAARFNDAGTARRRTHTRHSLDITIT